MRIKPFNFLKLLGAFFILVLIILNYNPILTYLEEIFKNSILELGYLGMFISIFILEFFPQPFISSLIPLSSGIIFGFDISKILIIAIISAVAANYLAYLLGVNYGEDMVRFFVNKKAQDKSLNWFEKHGKKSMTFLALTPLPYFPIMGGIFKMTTKEFILYALVPRMIYLVIFSLGVWVMI